MQGDDRRKKGHVLQAYRALDRRECPQDPLVAERGAVARSQVVLAYTFANGLLKGSAAHLNSMSHPDPNAPPDLRPIEIGKVWENPITRERATILELPHQNLERRAVAELVARAGAKVVGEHRHPGLLERFSALEGELTVKRSGETSILRQGETITIEPNVWHDWWNAGDRDARVRVEVTPGDRFAHMIETF
jgi:quercetin dioxygenase-like cupin family protein